MTYNNFLGVIRTVRAFANFLYEQSRVTSIISINNNKNNKRENNISLNISSHGYNQPYFRVGV